MIARELVNLVNYLSTAEFVLFGRLISEVEND